MPMHFLSNKFLFRYYDRVMDERKVKDEWMSQDEDEDEDVPITERERPLEGLTSEFDLALFREAQAQASEVGHLDFFFFFSIVSDLPFIE